MGEVRMIAVDLAKRFFQVHGSDAGGAAIFNRSLPRSKLVAFLAGQPRCVVAMEACGSAHHWGRTFAAMGFQVRLLPAREVKPFVRLPKTDASDAAAIAEAARRPQLRTVPVKSAAAQAVCSAHAIRERLVAARTAQINMLRSHLAEFGIVSATGREGFRRLEDLVRTGLGDLPAALTGSLLALVETIAAVEKGIAAVEGEIASTAQANDDVRRLRTIPGLGLLSASAVLAFAGDMRRFESGRAFVAWLGLSPRVEASGGKARHGGITKQGQVYVRTLLIHGARAVVYWKSQGKAGGRSPWLDALAQRRPAPVVITAMAAKLARIAWAVVVRGGEYRAPVVPAAAAA